MSQEVESGRWMVSSAAMEGPVVLRTDSVRLSDVPFGDFNGDGTDDALRSANGALEVSLSIRERTAWSGWTKISTSVAEIGELAIGDFNGDKIADVFRPDSVDRAWYISYGYSAGSAVGQSDWQRVNDSDIPLSPLAIGDFHGDGKDDVFRSDSGI